MSMQLIWATEEFVVKGRSYLGFPILLYDGMESCVQANSFLRHYLFRGVIGSKQSWPSTGRALYDFFSFLQAHNLRWDDVQRGEEHSLVGAYRDYCLDVVKLARNTVRQRLVYVCKFYEYARSKMWIDSLPFGYEERMVKRDGDFLTHVDASGGRASVRDVSPKKHRDLPKFLSKDQVKTLLDAAANPHHKMMIRFALQTGLRREEIATFPVAYISDPDRAGSGGRNIRIRLDPQDGTGMCTKGSKPRDIYVSRGLLRDLYYYVIHTRGERACLSEETCQQLFVNHRGETFAANGKGIEKIVRNIGKRAGIKAHPHILRHTYATHTLYMMQRSKTTIDPLVYLQNQLGHESILTTMTYLHLINECADDAVLAYDDELND